MGDRKGKARKHRTKCDACGGRGYHESGVGFAAIQKMYPELPIGAMHERRWFGPVDAENASSCENAFLAFYGVSSHAELRQKREARSEFPWNVGVT